GDTIQVGDRVRVRVGTTGSANTIIGNVKRIVADTLELSLPGGKGEITLPRAAIDEISESRGMESYRPLLRSPTPGPALALSALSVARAVDLAGHAHSRSIRASSVLLAGLGVLRIVTVFHGERRERWEPVTAWLNR